MPKISAHGCYCELGTRASTAHHLRRYEDFGRDAACLRKMLLGEVIQKKDEDCSYNGLVTVRYKH